MCSRDDRVISHQSDERLQHKLLIQHFGQLMFPAHRICETVFSSETYRDCRLELSGLRTSGAVFSARLVETGNFWHFQD